MSDSITAYFCQSFFKRKSIYLKVASTQLYNERAFTYYERVQIRTIATTATNILECKKVLTFLLSVLTSDWLKQQKLTKLHNAVHISSRIFENIPQNGPEDSHRKLAIASFLVAAVRKNIGGLLSW